MCTAYEVGGKKRGSDPGFIDAQAVGEFLLVKNPVLIRPTVSAPVILPNGSLERMIWGFRRSFAPKAKGGKPTWRSIVNAREDKLGGHMWKSAFDERRCLIPAASFFEWVVMDRNGPLQFERPDDEWMWIAGIWETDEERGNCFSMITTDPNGLVAPVHDRMPAVLTEDQVPRYLAGELHEFGPSRVALAYQVAENFLRKRDGLDKASPPSSQGELF